MEGPAPTAIGNGAKANVSNSDNLISAGTGNNRVNNDFPLFIAEWERNSREVIRVVLDRYNGKVVLAVRVWYRDGDGFKPGKAGLTLSIKHLPDLAGAFSKALDEANSLGLLADGGAK